MQKPAENNVLKLGRNKTIAQHRRSCCRTKGHEGQFGHAILSTRRNNTRCCAGKANLQLEDANASDNTQRLNVALPLHSLPESQAGDNAGVRTPSESSDADNIPYQYTQTLKAAAVAVVAVVAGGEETAVVVTVAATLVAVGRIHDDPRNDEL